MNKAILMGRLTKDPEVRYTQTDNTMVVTFSLAVNRRFSKGDETDFINIVAWGKTAEFCSKYFKKGQQVAIVGRIQTRQYDDKDGKRVYVTEVIAEETYFAGNATAHNEQPESNPFAAPTQKVTLADVTQTMFQAPVTDDDLPF